MGDGGRAYICRMTMTMAIGFRVLGLRIKGVEAVGYTFGQWLHKRKLEDVPTLKTGFAIQAGHGLCNSLDMLNEHSL